MLLASSSTFTFVAWCDTHLHVYDNDFSAQRNTYLTGFALFLSLCLTRTFYIILDHIHVQDEYAKLKKEVSSDRSPRCHFRKTRTDFLSL